MVKPLTSFNIFENFEFSKFRYHATGCVVYYNFLVIKTGPSHNKLELIDPDNFPNSSVSRKQNAREHRKFTIGAWAFDSAIDPGAVFLYGVTTLRNTWNIRCGAARQWNSRQRKKKHQFWCPNPSPASIFSKISNFRNFGVMPPVAWVTITFLFRNGEAWDQDRTKP